MTIYHSKLSGKSCRRKTIFKNRRDAYDSFSVDYSNADKREEKSVLVASAHPDELRKFDRRCQNLFGMYL